MISFWLNNYKVIYSIIIVPMIVCIYSISFLLHFKLMYLIYNNLTKK